MLISEKYRLSWEPDGYESECQSFLTELLGFNQGNDVYEDYRTFYFTTNPYQKVLDLYMNKILPEYTPIFKDKKNSYIERFRSWVSKIFITEKLIVSLRYENTVDKNSKILKRYKISKSQHDFVVRDDRYISDLGNHFNLVLNNLPKEYKWKIYEFYDFETAKIIFQFYKFEFLYGQYDPFSFSESIIEKDYRMNFIHEPF